MNPKNEMDSRASFEVKNPRNGTLLYQVEEPDQAEVDRVYAKAEAAFEQLRRMSVRERLNELKKIKTYLLNNHERVARRIVEETGKCLADAFITEVFAVVDMLAYYEKNAERMLADRTVPASLMLMGKKSRIVFEPMGVVLIISPWNYPFNLSILPFICAFLAGNSVILKPSKETPLRGVYEDMIAESGFLPDALQVVYASRRTANRLIDQRPAKIHFTGSVSAGRKVMARAASLLIPVELELGGKDPLIVFDDADLERAVNGALWGAFVNSGQTCTSIERIYVQQNIYEDFLAALKEKAERIRTLATPGNENDEYGLMMGCMTAEFQIQEIERQLEESIPMGACVITGGKRIPGTHVFPPTIVVDVTPDMPVQCEETFGPVVTVTSFRDEDEAVRLANDSVFGLAASVWSGDAERAWRVARRITAGNVSINNALATQANPALPFGGIKDSGFGRYKGEMGLHAFSNIKSILADKNSNRLEAYWYPYSREKYDLLQKAMIAVYRGGPLRLVKGIFAGLKLEAFSRRHRL